MNEWQALERCKHLLTKQQYRTIKGQLRAGDTAGAMRGLIKLTGGGEPHRSQEEARHEKETGSRREAQRKGQICAVAHRERA